MIRGRSSRSLMAPDAAPANAGCGRRWDSRTSPSDGRVVHAAVFQNAKGGGEGLETEGIVLPQPAGHWGGLEDGGREAPGQGQRRPEGGCSPPNRADRAAPDHERRPSSRPGPSPGSRPPRGGRAPVPHQQEHLQVEKAQGLGKETVHGTCQGWDPFGGGQKCGDVEPHAASRPDPARPRGTAGAARCAPTVETDERWPRRFLRFHRPRHPREMGSEEVNALASVEARSNFKTTGTPSFRFEFDLEIGPERCAGNWYQQAGQLPQLASFFCHTSIRERTGHSHNSGIDASQGPKNNNDLYARSQSRTIGRREPGRFPVKKRKRAADNTGSV